MAETLLFHSCLLIVDSLNLAVVESSPWCTVLDTGFGTTAPPCGAAQGGDESPLSQSKVTDCESHVICAISASDSAFHVFHLFLSLYFVWLCSLLIERRVCFGGMGESTWHSNRTGTCLTGTPPSPPQGTQWQLVGTWDIWSFSLHFSEFQQSEIKNYEIWKNVSNVNQEYLTVKLNGMICRYLCL